MILHNFVLLWRSKNNFLQWEILLTGYTEAGCHRINRMRVRKTLLKQEWGMGMEPSCNVTDKPQVREARWCRISWFNPHSYFQPRERDWVSHNPIYSRFLCFLFILLSKTLHKWKQHDLSYLLRKIMIYSSIQLKSYGGQMSMLLIANVYGLIAMSRWWL